MATIFENKDRRVIPNWRSFKKTANLGELDRIEIRGQKFPIKLSIDSYIDDYRENKNTANAADLISAGFVNGFEKDEAVVDAAEFILKNHKSSTKSQLSTAQRILHGKTANNLDDIDSISFTDCDNYLDIKSIWVRIHSLKQLLVNFQYNPVLWVELSRQYSIIGQKKQAENAMKIALQLAPDNRFIMRSAVRLFAHYQDLEFSHDIVRKNSLTNFDPWLASAEISLATIRGRTSRFIKRGIEMINSRSLSPFSVTELASSIGTLEILSGNRKKSRELFQKSLISPNDNSLAQIEWASKLDKQLEVNQDEYTVRYNYEAKALDNFNQKKLNIALNDTFHWFLDMPFSKRPVLLGSHISQLLNDKEKVRDFLNAGLISHPNDPQLLNNLAYSYALENKTNEALELIKSIGSDDSIEQTTKICLTATRGLIYFRSGFHEQGRGLYIKAIQDAKALNNEYYAWVASLNFVREEILINSEVVEPLMQSIAVIPENDDELYVKKLKKEVIDLYDELKSKKL